MKDVSPYTNAPVHMIVGMPGRYVAVAASEKARIPVLSAPTGSIRVMARLPHGCEVEVIGQAGPWLHVRLPDGRTGYVAQTSLVPVTANNAQGTGMRAKGSPRPIFPEDHRGSRVLASFLCVVAGIGIVFGVILATITVNACPYGVGAAGLSRCTVTDYPLLTPGLVLIGIGVIAALLAFVILRGARND